MSAARARFQDLLRLARQRVALSTFHLEDDALVSATSLLDEVQTSGLRLETATAPADGRVFTHEALMFEPIVAAATTGSARSWLALRRIASCDDPRFRGFTGAQQPKAYAVSRVERYLECPFKYFAAHVLKLPEERDEEAWMTPQERGQFVHEVFFELLLGMAAAGPRRRSRPRTSRDALALFEERRGRHLARAARRGPRARAHAAARIGRGSRARRARVRASRSSTTCRGRAAARVRAAGHVRVRRWRRRAADRASCEGGSHRPARRRHAAHRRLQDWAERRNRERSLQLPVYGVCAAQALDGRHGRSWTSSRAGYVAFREKKPFVSLGRNAQELEKALADGEARLLRRGRRHRARRVPGAARRAVPLHLVRVRRASAGRTTSAMSDQ